MQQAGLQKSEAQEPHSTPRRADLVGHIASIRATVAVTPAPGRGDRGTGAAGAGIPAPRQPARCARRRPGRWAMRYELQGNRPRRAPVRTSPRWLPPRPIGHFIVHADVDARHRPHAGGRQPTRAGRGSYRVALKLAGDPPLPAACRGASWPGALSYAWNDLAAAEEHAQQSLYLAQPTGEHRPFHCQRGDVGAAAAGAR
jgi:LuxR family maltose regulon positive regulatory protein